LNVSLRRRGFSPKSFGAAENLGFAAPAACQTGPVRDPDDRLGNP